MGTVRVAWGRAAMAVVGLALATIALLVAPAAAMAAGTITGTVVDKLGGSVANAEVAVMTVAPNAGYATAVVATTTASASGTYSVDVPAGNYLVAARLTPGYPDYQFFTTRRGGNAMNPPLAVINLGVTPVADLATVANINIRLLEPAFIEGTVRRASDGSVLPSITVAVAQYVFGEGWDLVEETVTRPDGTYRLQTIPPAQIGPGTPFKLQFSDVSGVYASQIFDNQIYFEAGADFDPATLDVMSGIDASLTAGSRITGTVTSALTGLPVPAVSVEVFRFVPLAGVWEPVNLGHGLILTDVLGGYSWGGLPPGDYKVKFAGDPGVYGAEFYGGVHANDPNIVPAEALTVSIPVEGAVVPAIDGQLDLFDGAAPLTSSNVTPGWKKAPFQVSLSATDQVLPGTGIASGVAWTRYRVDAGAVATGTSFSVATEGVRAVQFRSADVYGNVESTRTVQLYLDGTPPTTTDDAVATYVDFARISLTATDALSGVASTRVSLDGAPSVVATSVLAYGKGTHTLAYRSIDAVGNSEATQTVSFDITYTPVASSIVASSTRVLTSIEISRRTYSDATGTPGAVVIATSLGWSDALGGAALAGAVDGPVLLVDPAAPGAITAELQRLQSLGASRAFLLGGRKTLPATVASSVAGVFGDANVERLGGSDRFATSKLIAQRTVAELGPAFDGTVFVASGATPFDALAASPIAAHRGWPVLLAPVASDGTMANAFASDLANLGADRAIIVGGPASVSPAFAAELSSTLLGAVQRLSGTNRYSAAAAIADYGVRSAGMTYDGLAIANGETYADALAASAMQGSKGSVLLLTGRTGLATPTRDALRTNRPTIFSVVFIGGDVSMPPAVRQAALNALAQ